MKYGIYREAGVQARARRRQFSPRPKRVAVVEAADETAALEAFARAEEARSRQVSGWHVAARRLVVTLANGRNVHEAVYVAWRMSR